MFAHDICGFIVVRLPEFDENLRPPPVPGKVYRGVDRLRWEISERAGEDTKLAMRCMLRQVEHEPLGFSVIHPVTQDLSIAKEFMRHDESVNEVLAVYSDRLADLGGSFKCNGDLEGLGHELFAAMEWSPHWHGVFWRPEAFPDVLPLLNQHGLFDTEDGLTLLAERYVALMREGIVEPLADPPDFVALRLYRVL